MSFSKRVCLSLLTALTLIVSASCAVNPEEMDFESEKIQSYKAEFQSDAFDSIAITTGIPTTTEPDWNYNNYLNKEYVWKESVDSVSEICETVDFLLDGANSASCVYLQIDPWILYNSFSCSKENEKPMKYDRYLGKTLVKCVAAYPNVTFDIVLPSYSLSYWQDNNSDEILDVWYKLLQKMLQHNNVVARFRGAEEWLVCNDSNYLDGINLNEEISRKLFFLTYDADSFKCSADEFLEKSEYLKSLIEKKNNHEYEYSGLEGKKLVFIGDSLFRYTEEDTASIPGIMSSFSGAEAFNFAIGGTTATKNARGCFNDSVEEIISDSEANKPETLISSGGADIISKDDDIVFFVLYGANDFFGDREIYEENVEDKFDSFEGALKAGIERLKSYYVNSEVILVAPYQMSEYGFEANKYSLKEYIQASERVAAYENIPFANLYTLGIVTYDNMSEYLADNVHPRNNMNLIIAEELLNIMK